MRAFYILHGNNARFLTLYGVDAVSHAARAVDQKAAWK
jgi:hypothetical protein